MLENNFRSPTPSPLQVPVPSPQHLLDGLYYMLRIYIDLIPKNKWMITTLLMYKEI
jgi:hypothetical protein